MTVKLNYQIQGEGIPVIILHGLFGSSRNWATIARKLAADYQVINVDLRNHGDSECADSMSYPEMADDIHDLLDECGLVTVNIIGHSMGGKVAMAFALNHASRLEKTIVLDIAPVAYRNEYSHLIDALEKITLDNIKNRKEANESLRAEIPEEMLRQFLLHNLVQDSDGFRWRINLQAIKNNLTYITGFLGLNSKHLHTGSALFLGGGNSNYIQPEHHAIIKTHFPNAEIQTVEGSGHWLHAEKPQEVLEKITTFLIS